MAQAMKVWKFVHTEDPHECRLSFDPPLLETPEFNQLICNVHAAIDVYEFTSGAKAYLRKRDVPS
jgi:hypothetical protein